MKDLSEQKALFGECILQDFLQRLLLGSLKLPRDGSGNGVMYVRHVRECATGNQDLFVVI